MNKIETDPSVGARVAMEAFSRGIGSLYGMSRRRIYLAGPMSGLPDFNYPAFNAEAERLRGLGYHVENPAETPEKDSWSGYMRHALAKLVTCDEVALLPGWSQSQGAFMEYSVASRLGMPCRRAAEFVAQARHAACT